MPLSQDMQFPPLFAIIASDDGAAGRGRATIYQSSLVRDGPDRWGESPSIYHIAPYRIFHGVRDQQYPDEAFLLTALRRITQPRHDVMLVADLPDPHLSADSRLPTRQLFYQGRWEPTGQTVFSLFCATPIPVLDLPSTNSIAGRLRWPAPAYNRLPVVPVENDFVAIWQRRWELPAALDGERSEATGGRSEPTGGRSEPTGGRSEPTGGAAGGAGARHPPPLSPPAPRLIPVLAPPPPIAPPPLPAAHRAGPSAIATELPSFVANAIVGDAIARGLQCPITMESIADITAPVAVTNCYHVFESAALTDWMRTGDGTCPICKTRI